ncbi:MAG: tetratricopeptide repeat protein [Byssovorax sp.]
MTPARSWSSRAAACALFAGVALASAGASAQPLPGSSPAMAEALFQQARDLFKQERYAEACPRFAESQRLEPKLGTLLNLAVCHEKIGKIATAWAEYTSAATIARRDGSKEREDFARDQVAILEKKIARVVVQADASPAGPSVTLDDQPLDRTALNMPLPIDPGKHRIGAATPGKIAWSTVIEVPSERADLTVPIPALAAAVEQPQPTVAPLPAPPVATPIAPSAPRSAPEPVRGGNLTLAYTGFGVGAAGVLVGAIAGGFTLAQAGSIREHCTANRCDSDQAGPLGSATAVANVANVGFTIGAIGLAVGVAGLFVARASAPAPRGAATLTPILGPGAVGLRGSF